MKIKESKFHYAWIILAIATIVMGAFVPIVTSLSNTWQIVVTKELGFSRTAFSFSGTITQAVGIFLGPVVSYFLTKYNFKRIWTAAALLFSAAVFGYSFAQNQYHFYVLSVIVGVSYITTTSIPMMMMVNNWFQEKRGIATSIAVSGISAGGAILSPIVTKLIEKFGWRASYRVYAFIILTFAVLFGFFLIYLKPEDKGLLPYGYKENNDKNKKEEDNRGSLNVGLKISTAISCAFFIFLILGAVMNGLSNGATLQFPPALQHAAGFETASKVISVYLLLGVFGKLLLGRIADKYGIYKSLTVGSGSLALTFVLMLFIGQSWGPWAVAIMFGLGLALGSVMPPLITSSIFNKEIYGESYGFVQSGVQVGAAIGPLLVSFIFDKTGSYNGAWIINIVFALLTGGFWFFAHKAAKKYANKTEK